MKKYFSRFLFTKRVKIEEKDKEFTTKINNLIGFKLKNIDLYKEAFSLKTAGKGNETKNYERMEFLGDAVLGSIISCYLFATYPEGNEGFLTKMKAKIVNRKNLNQIGEKLNLIQFIDNKSNITLSENIAGNLLEAFIGAIYIDLDYNVCKKIIFGKLFDMDELVKLENKVTSYKSLLLEWSQKKKVSVTYDTIEEHMPNKITAFTSTVLINNVKKGKATDFSKKKAEEKAAQRTFYSINKKENILENQKPIS